MSKEQYRGIHHVVNDQGSAMYYRNTVKEEMLVALATKSVAILSPGMAIKILCLGLACMQPCNSKGLSWPFIHFYGGLL